MSLTSHHLFTNSLPSSRLTVYFNVTLNNHNHNHLSLLPPLNSRHFIHISQRNPLDFTPNSKYYHSLKPLNCHDNTGITPPQTRDSFNLDSLLSISELVCLLSSTVITTGFVVNNLILGSKDAFLGLIGKRVLACGVLGLVCGVWIGSVIRRRQWWRICRETAREQPGGSVNLVERIEKLEEDLRSYATIIRVLSRQLEKLGIRFRVTRKALKEPISQTAALAQKNSEATRTLAMQEEVLEKELGEIQKVLLAMQEQQHKQLDLILAIGKTGKLLESRREPSQEQVTLDKSKLADGKTHETQSLGSIKGSKNDRV
ncbi:hypothetical protein LWI29_033848 [Acer saccharum]|uniref:Transmembrane protein n=1 Tax=Acer saccharum TaxID=4024 RepID=A0AA39TF62_ACESA|nr:hypothetical protein LWI29_033848 [Acer saccharum]KAK1588071.1 hypothetical protein Q3G72_019567 [Acer saccharum]